MMATERTYPAYSPPAVRSVTISLYQYWHRIGLGAVLLLATVLDFYSLSREGYSNTYYAAAIRSMAQSWHNFFFASFDPAGFVTIDKPPLGFWLQVASVKLFGYSGVALMLPQALAGVLSVALLYYLVSRLFGRPAGLIAALALAITPIAVVSNRNNIVDSTLVLAVLLGAWAISRAVETGKLRWLLLCAVFVGLGFNIKMLEAYLVIPAFGLMYLVGARAGWRKRIGHLFLAGLVLLTVSLSWVTAVDLTPASQRPWVGSTTNNSELSLAIGYNGIQRLTGNSSVGGTRNGRAGQSGQTANRNAPSTGTAPKSTPGGTAPSATGRSSSTGPGGGGPGGAGGGPGGVGENGPTGILRLLDAQLGGQIGWFLPLAVIGLVIAAWQTRRRLPAGTAARLLQNGQRSALAMWGMWLLTMDVFFDIAGFYHTYYLVMIAPAIAALAGIGIVALWRAFRESGGKLWWLLPATLLAVAAIQVRLLAPYQAWSRWLSPLILVLPILGSLALVLLHFRPRLGVRPALAGVIVGLAALLAAPAVWSAETVMAADSGLTPRAGPAGTTNVGGFGGFAARGNRAFTPPGGSFQPPNGGQPPSNNQGGPPSGSGGTFPPPNGNGETFAPPSSNGSAQPRAGDPRFNGGPGGAPGGDQVNTTLLKYLEAHQGKATYLFATTNAGSAESYIIATGKAVMAMGGFTGSDPILTTTRLATLAREGKVKYFLTAGGGFGGPGGGASGSLTAWIQQHSRLITVGGTQLYEYTG